MLGHFNSFFRQIFMFEFLISFGNAASYDMDHTIHVSCNINLYPISNNMLLFLHILSTLTVHAFPYHIPTAGRHLSDTRDGDLS